MLGQHEETGEEIPEKVFQLGSEATVGVCWVFKESGRVGGQTSLARRQWQEGPGGCEELETHPRGWRRGYTGLLGAADGPTMGSGL